MANPNQQATAEEGNRERTTESHHHDSAHRQCHASHPTHPQAAQHPRHWQTPTMDMVLSAQAQRQHAQQPTMQHCLPSPLHAMRRNLHRRNQQNTRNQDEGTPRTCTKRPTRTFGSRRPRHHERPPNRLGKTQDPGP